MRALQKRIEALESQYPAAGEITPEQWIAWENLRPPMTWRTWLGDRYLAKMRFFYGNRGNQTTTPESGRPIRIGHTPILSSRAAISRISPMILTWRNGSK